MLDLQTSLDLCTYCPRLCSQACPVSLVEARETVTPQAKMARFASLRRRAAQGEAGGPSSSLYACTGCGACTDVCLHHVEPGIALMQGRAHLATNGAALPEVLDLPPRFREQARAAADSVRAAVPAERLRSTSALAYLPSCETGRDGQAAGDEALAAMRVCDRLAETMAQDEQAHLAQLGRGDALPPVALPAVSLLCGGYPLYAAGLFERFRLHAENLAQEIQGHATVILGCAPCTWLLRTQYRVIGVPLRPKILHLAEFLFPLADALPVKRRVPAAAYHDSCYLGRHLQVMDEPRRLLHQVAEQVIEFPRHRAEARCCGGGGLLPLTAPATAKAMAEERLMELDGALPLVVSGCAMCQRQLSIAGRERGTRSAGLLELLDEATAP
jgi:Fe-S oxidoreductase